MRTHGKKFTAARAQVAPDRNYTIEEAEELLTRIEGHLNDKSMKQLRYGYENDSFEMSFRPFEDIATDEDGGEE